MAMPGKRISKDNKGQSELYIRWERGFKSVELYYYTEYIGGFASKEELYRGKEFRFNGGEYLFIRFNKELEDFEFKRNGEYIAGSGFQPTAFLSFPSRLQLAYGSVMGFFTAMFAIQYFNTPHMFTYYAVSALYCLSLVVLSFFLRKGSQSAFYLSLFLIITYSLWQPYMLLYWLINSGFLVVVLILLLLFRISILYQIVKGWKKFSLMIKSGSEDEILI